MQRALAEVLALKPIPSAETRERFSRYLMKVRIKDPACKGYLLPPRTKGRVHHILRDYPRNCEPPLGAEVVLTPLEVSNLLRPLRIEPPVVEPSPDGLSFTVRLHNPTRKKSRYRLNAPFLGQEVAGSITEEERLRLTPSKKLPEGCHRIEVMARGSQAVAVVPIPEPGSILSYELDVDGDGFPEKVLENDFLRLSVAPHLGARCRSIRLKRSRMDLLTETFEYGKEEYVEYGGADEHIGDFPGDFWKAKFKEVETDGSSVVLSHSLRGLELRKQVELLPSLPMVRHSIIVRKTSGGEKDILYWHRMVLATDDPSWSTLLHLRTRERPERVRHTSPASFWRERRDYYAVQTGTVAVQHETSREVLCFSTHPDSLELAGSTSARGYHLFTPHFRRKKLKAGEESEYRFAYILGDDFALDSSGCFVVSTGPWNGEKRLLSVVAKVDGPSCDVEASLSTGQPLHLESADMKGIGTILSATAEVASPESTVVQLRTKDREYSLRTTEAG